MALKLYREHPRQLFRSAAGEPWDLWDFPFPGEERAFPACDFHEDKNHYFISMDMPGMGKEDIKISLKDNALSVSGERKDLRKESDKQIHSCFVEKFYGAFHREFALPSAVDEEKISAQFTNGVLEMLIPKSSAGKGREITVREGGGAEEGGLFSRFSKNKKPAQ